MRKLYEPFVRTGKPILVMDPAVGGAHEVRGQRHARDAHLVHERDRELLRPGGRGRAAGAHGHGHGQPDRLVLPVPRGGLRRVLLPEGREGAHPHGRRRPTFACTWSRPWSARTRSRRPCSCPRVAAHLGGLAGKTVAVWGLAFKPRTDDMREAPAIAIIEGLLAGGAAVRAYDPKAEEQARRVFGDRVTLCGRAYEAVDRRRRARGGHGVERVPRAGLREDPRADAAPGDLRRPQHLQPRRPARPRLPLRGDRPAVTAPGEDRPAAHAARRPAPERRDARLQRAGHRRGDRGPGARGAPADRARRGRRRLDRRHPGDPRSGSPGSAASGSSSRSGTGARARRCGGGSPRRRATSSSSRTPTSSTARRSTRTSST